LSPETSAFKLQTPGKFPEEYKLHSEHGESLKTATSTGLLLYVDTSEWKCQYRWTTVSIGNMFQDLPWWSAEGSKSIIDYIVVNRRPKNLAQDFKIFRGSDIGSDQFLVTSRINLLSRWKQQSNNSRLANEFVYKVYLLQEESIQRLYQ